MWMQKIKKTCAKMFILGILTDVVVKMIDKIITKIIMTKTVPTKSVPKKSNEIRGSVKSEISVSYLPFYWLPQHY